MPLWELKEDQRPMTIEVLALVEPTLRVAFDPSVNVPVPLPVPTAKFVAAKDVLLVSGVVTVPVLPAWELLSGCSPPIVTCVAVIELFGPRFKRPTPVPDPVLTPTKNSEPLDVKLVVLVASTMVDEVPPFTPLRTVVYEGVPVRTSVAAVLYDNGLWPHDVLANTATKKATMEDVRSMPILVKQSFETNPTDLEI